MAGNTPTTYRDPKSGKVMSEKEVCAAAELRLTKARIQLLTYKDSNRRNPFVFWAACAMRLKPVAVPNMMQRGAGGPIGVDGTNMYYDPIFIMFGDPAIGAAKPWNDEELKGVVAHEVSHCVKGDMWRRGSREPQKWNIACDMRIDPELIKHGLTMPSHGQMDAMFKDPANLLKSAEQIYKELPDSVCRSASGGGDPMGNDVREGRGGAADPSQDPTNPQARMSQSEWEAHCEAMERKWQQIGRQAATFAKAQGTLPGSAAHLVEPIRPKLDPYDLIKHYVSMCRKDDYSFGRQNRRSLWRGMVLPTLYSEGVGELLIGIDTSGSCSRVIPKFLGFLNAVLTDCKPEKVVFMECDSYVQNVTVFENGEELAASGDVEVRGYGGTRMSPIWDKAAEMQLDPVCAIILTDCEMGPGDFGEEQHFPVLWVSSEKDERAPWGETVYLDGEH